MNTNERKTGQMFGQTEEDNNIGDKNMPLYGNIITVYQELCNSYRAIDDFRSKLLGFLPLASGTGIFLIAGEKIDNLKDFSLPIGIFGILITLGLFAYEIYGIKKCTALIIAGRKLEEQLKSENGQFKTRPNSLINESFAAAVIYPGVLAAWTFLSCLNIPNQNMQIILLIIVFMLGFIPMFVYCGNLLKNSTVGEKE